MSEPRFIDDPAFRALRSGEIKVFQRLIADRPNVDFSNTNLRGTDFKSIDLSKLILRGAYLRNADLRGCDLRHIDLEGVSLHSAQIAGTYFPANVSADEIQMSVAHGTRIRTSPARTPDAGPRG